MKDRKKRDFASNHLTCSYTNHFVTSFYYVLFFIRNILHISGIFGEEKSTKNEQYYFDSKKSAATLEFDLTLLDTSKT